MSYDYLLSVTTAAFWSGMRWGLAIGWVLGCALGGLGMWLIHGAN